MCPDIQNLTCYVGDYVRLYTLLSVSGAFGLGLGMMVGIISKVLKKGD